MCVYRLCEDSVDNLMHITVTMNDKSLEYVEVADHWAMQKQGRYYLNYISVILIVPGY